MFPWKTLVGLPTNSASSHLIFHFAAQFLDKLRIGRRWFSPPMVQFVEKIRFQKTGHSQLSKATGIEIGVQAGTRRFHDFDMESDDTDADELDVLAPVTEYVALALVVVSDKSQ